MNNFKLDVLIRENVKSLKPYSSARDEFTNFDDDLVFLDANENPFPTEVNRYPDPQQRSVKDLLAAQKGVPITSILLGNGSDEVLDLIFRAFCEPHKDTIISLPPTYGMYHVLSEVNAVKNKEVLLTSDFQPDVEKIIGAQDENTKLLFLCSPNNPTGTVFSEENIQALLAAFKGLVVIDEAYIDFSESNSWVTRIEEFPNLIITQTLSKAYGMAGIRLGVCYASKEIITVLNKIKPPYNVNELTQIRAFERLLNVAEVEQEVVDILNEKAVLEKVLMTIGYITKVFPSQANFILIRVDDASKRYQQLIEHGIVVRNRSRQPGCENTLRITIGTPEENQKLITVLNTLT